LCAIGLAPWRNPCCLVTTVPSRICGVQSRSNFPELRPPNTQNTVKIVSFIFLVIHDKRNLRPDLGFAQIHLRNSHSSALKCSTGVRYLFCPERLKTAGVGNTTLKKHQVRAARVGRNGIYFINLETKPNATVEFFEFASHKTIPIWSLTNRPFVGLSISADGKSILYAQNEFQHSDIMLVKNFR